MNERLQKLLSRAGILSRRRCEALMAEGRIRVNGQVVRTPGTKASRSDHILIDGRPVPLNRAPDYLLMYKPRGCMTTLSDPEGRTTVCDYLPPVGRHLFPVGRLDYASEGLLLFTNDGELAQSLMRPSHGVPRLYLVKVKGIPGPHHLQQLRRPFRLQGRLTRPAQIEVRSAHRNAVLEVTLTEGKKHHIREMFRRVGHPVIRLRRIAYGPIRDRALRPGRTRLLTSQEVRALRASVSDLAHEAASPGATK
ncbi:MAG: pseudouridine synthase [Acidobacteriota bacterium]